MILVSSPKAGWPSLRTAATSWAACRAAPSWHVINLCRFEPGELDDLIPGLRLPDNASFLDLPPWKPELRKDSGVRAEGS